VFNGFAEKDCQLLCSTGLLEYWSVGKSESLNFTLNWSFHYSITPADCLKRGMTVDSPQGLLKAGSFSPGFFTLTF
jgi:hypothetical protein